jgi:hypothetical protein
MPTKIKGSGIIFNDATTQTTTTAGAYSVFQLSNEEKRSDNSGSAIMPT